MFLIRLLRAIAVMLWATAQPAFRFLAWLALLFAVIALMHDVMRWQRPGVAETFQSLADHGRAFAPETLQSLQTAIDTGPYAWAWGPFVAWLLVLPLWFNLAVIGLLFALAARPIQKRQVFTN